MEGDGPALNHLLMKVFGNCQSPPWEGWSSECETGVGCGAKILYPLKKLIKKCFPYSRKKDGSSRLQFAGERYAFAYTAWH